MAGIGDTLRLEPQRPFLSFGIVQQAQSAQVRRGSWPVWQGGKEPLAADRDHGNGRDAIAAQAGIAAEAVTDRHVHAFGGKVRQAARGNDVQLDVRVARAKAAETRHQPGFRECRRRADREHAGAGRGLQATRRLADLAEGVADRHEIALTGFGQHEGAVAAPEQLRPEPFLEAAHELAYGAGRDRQFGGGLFHAEVAGGGLEGAQGVQRRQGHRRFPVSVQDRYSHPKPPRRIVCAAIMRCITSWS